MIILGIALGIIVTLVLITRIKRPGSLSLDFASCFFRNRYVRGYAYLDYFFGIRMFKDYPFAGGILLTPVVMQKLAGHWNIAMNFPHHWATNAFALVFALYPVFLLSESWYFFPTCRWVRTFVFSAILVFLLPQAANKAFDVGWHPVIIAFSLWISTPVSGVLNKRWATCRSLLELRNRAHKALVLLRYETASSPEDFSELKNVPAEDMMGWCHLVEDLRLLQAAKSALGSVPLRNRWSDIFSAAVAEPPSVDSNLQTDTDKLVKRYFDDQPKCFDIEQRLESLKKLGNDAQRPLQLEIHHLRKALQCVYSS